jgi:hypothetical protein
MVTRVNRAIQARNAVPCRTGADHNLVGPDNNDGPGLSVKSSVIVEGIEVGSFARGRSSWDGLYAGLL